MKKNIVMLKRNSLKKKYRLLNGPLYLDDLTDDQRIELKQSMLFHDDDGSDLPVSYGELADADTLISNKKMRRMYGETTFSPDDFFCSCGN